MNPDKLNKVVEVYTSEELSRITTPEILGMTDKTLEDLRAIQRDLVILIDLKENSPAKKIPGVVLDV